MDRLFRISKVWAAATLLGALVLLMAPAEASLHRTLDLDIGEEARVELRDGSLAHIRIVGVQEGRESVTGTLDEAVVTLEINGQRVDLVSGNYRLPASVGGVQVDVPAVRALMKDAHIDWWSLRRDVRVRLWPADSPWIEPGTFIYPAKQRWFASMTSFSNEPVSRRANGLVYYHAGMDIGGAEGLIEVVAATDGVIRSLGNEVFGDPHPAVRERYDVVYVEDGRGWIYRYSHLKTFDPALRAGGRVRQGQRLGYIGKEGGSGGWTHLHFAIDSLQPSGEWGVEDSYAFLWQAYREQHDPAVIAVARPHKKALIGEAVLLDASRSWARSGIRSFEWTFLDGTRATGPAVRRVYERPGTYSEIVKVTDSDGNVGYDFATVRVYAGAAQDGTASVVGVHAVYAPTFGIKPGDPVIFLSRGRSTGPGSDVYDFGDGSRPVAVPSNIDDATHAANGYGATVHHFKAPGDYIVKVERIDTQTGLTAVQHLHVVVEP